MKYVLGADVGTTRTKCILFDGDGRAVAWALRDYRCHREAAGRCEQEADDWWRALVECVLEVMRAAPPRAAVEALSVATQGGTMVPVDACGRPLRRAIVWNDSRCAQERARFAQSVAPDQVWQKTGWQLGEGLNALQICWLRANEPELFARTWKFLSVPDYISFRLTGRCAIDPSNAGINQLADIDRKAWDAQILRAVGIQEGQLSEIVDSGAVVGNLCPEAAQALGLSERTLVVAGAHDQYMSALGAGAVKDGDLFLATGTCWVVAQLSEKRPDRFAVSRSAMPGLWGALKSQESGGEALDWLRERVIAAAGICDYARIDQAAAHAPAGANGVSFYPYLTGAYHPVVDSTMRAAWLGLSGATDWRDMARAVMEGVCFQALWMMEEFGPSGEQAIQMTGGATRSDVWVQIMADIAGRPVSIPAIADAGCAGAGILAGAAAGLFDSALEGARAVNKSGRTVWPSEAAAAYRPLYERYRRNAEGLIRLER